MIAIVTGVEHSQLLIFVVEMEDLTTDDVQPGDVWDRILDGIEEEASSAGNQ